MTPTAHAIRSTAERLADLVEAEDPIAARDLRALLAEHAEQDVIIGQIAAAGLAPAPAPDPEWVLVPVGLVSDAATACRWMAMHVDDEPGHIAITRAGWHDSHVRLRAIYDTAADR